MWDSVRGLMAQWEAALEYEVKGLGERSYRAVVTLGMGGSAFGAEVARSWAEQHCAIPWLVLRDYRLPGWVDDEVLVIAASYSGTTEETLSAADSAIKRGCVVVGLSSGGTLKTWAQEGSLTALIELPAGYAPRAAVAYSIGAQLAITEGAGLIPPAWRSEGQAFLTALKTHQPPSAELEKLATQWKERFIALYATEPYAALALRARQQIQENAKHLAWHHTLPEMNHNEIVGLQYPNLSSHLAVWLIDGHYAHPRHRLRRSFLENLLKERGIPFATLICPAPLPYLAEMLWLLHAIDLFSLHLAEAHGVDPTPVPIIDTLKAYLAQQG